MVGRERAPARTAQGAYPTALIEAPWIDARVMERGSVAPKSRRWPYTTEARIVRGYELLLDGVDEFGDVVAKPTASAVFETDCPVLGSPVLTLSGETEVLTNGEDLIGYLCHADVPAERS